jgi:predicted permease
MDMLLQDLRYAIRALRKSPLFTVVAVLTLALGIGANTTIYTWLNGIVLHPLPAVRDYDRLVLVISRGPDGERWSFSIPDWQDMSRAVTTVDGLAIANTVPLSVRTDGQAERTWGEVVSANYFDVLQVRPMLGRGFLPAEDSALGGHPVVVLSEGYWRRKFGGDPGIIGRVITLNSHPFTVVGVMPPHFGGNAAVLQFDMWVPLSMVGEATGSPEQYIRRNWGSYEAFARLKPGITIEQARREIQTIGRRFADTYVEDRNEGKDVLPMSEDYAQAMFKPALIAVLGITAIVLLIACANVANLLLARASARRKEMGIRLALGARRWTLVRQLLIESLIVSVVGGAGGLLIASWGGGLMGALMPPVPYPVNLDMHIDGRVLLFALAVTVSTVMLFGLVPALNASRPDLVPALKSAAGSSVRARGWLRGSLVVAQISLCAVALVAAGLFMRSLGASSRIDAGFRAPDRVLLVSTDLFLAGYNPSTGRVLQRELLDRVRSLPGVSSATFAGIVPLGFGGNNTGNVTIDGYVPAKDENMAVHNDAVTPHYFETLGTPLLAGREFTEQDDSGSMRVVVVNEAFAKKYLPGRDPIGKWVDFGGGKRTIIGVAATAKYRQLNERPLPYVFLPLAQDYNAGLTLHVRAAGDPKLLTESLRRTFASLDPNLPFLDVRTFQEHMGAAVFFMRLGAIMLGLFGGLALLLSAMGIYSVIAYSVSQRTREIGIRTALGAARRDILSLVVGEGMVLTGIGIVIGGALAFAVGRLLQSQLVGVGAGDPVTFLSIGTLLAIVAAVACWVPARRASRVDPVVALRTE